MTNFCGLNAEQGITSSSRYLDFTSCFENSVLLTLPALYLLIFGTWRILGCSRAKIVGTNNVAYYVKIAFALLHFALSISLLITGYLRYDAQEPSLYMGLSAFVFGSALSVCLVHAEHFRNIVSSSVLVVYWLLVFLSCVIRLRTYVSVADYSLSYFILLCAYTSLCLVQIALQHCASNTMDGYTAIEQDSFNDDGEHEHHLTPEETSGFFTILTFSWMNDLMKKGYQRPLEEQDLPDLQNQYKSRNVSRDFEYYWQQELKKNNPSLLWAFVRCYGPSFAFAGLFKLAQDSLAFLQPQFLKLLMKFIDSWNPLVGSQEKQSEFVGFLICLLMLITAWTQSWMLHQYFHMCLVVGMKIRAATVTAVYRKGLKLSNSSRQTFTAGEIVNHQSVDAQRFQDLMGYLHLLWSGPFQIALALYFLYQELGPSLFAGVSFMLIMIPLNTWLANLDARYEKEQMENKDRRMKFIDEALNGIKILKFYAWEKIFDKKITEVRDKELAVLKSLGVVNAFQSFAWACAPFFVTFFSFTTYIFVGDAPLTSQKVFSSIALFNLLQFPMSIFPYVISSSVQAGISLKRVHRYLTSENLSKYVGRKEFSEKLPAVEIVNDSFSWEKNGNPILSNITLKLQRKSITAVIGKVGCGKSSLVSAILEEMCTVGVDCSVLVSGSVAYVGQQAWIMNASFRDNILFGKPYDKEFYEKVLYSCALIPDLKILPAGDLTEIGEKGINLSGGQKQRLSIARAVYSRADIYLLDDPLSAVDAHVGRHIFDNVLGKSGLLAEKSRLFVTHAIQYVPSCDSVCIMEDGTITQGPVSFQEAMSQESGRIKRFIGEYLKEKSQESELSADHLDEEALETLDCMAETSGVVLSSSFKSRGPSPTAVLERKPDEVIKVAAKDSDENLPENVLMEQEKSVKGKVSWSVYADYAKACSVWRASIVIVTLVLAQLVSVVSNVWLERWSSENDRGSKNSNVLFNLIVYGSLGLVYATLVVSCVMMLWVLCAVRAARVMHSSLLEAVLRSPMSFFDTTPLGRIVNRFSKDVYSLDESIPQAFFSFFRTFVAVSSILVVIVSTTPLFGILIIPIAFIYYFVARYYLATSRELKRLDSVTKSPIYAHFSETLNGVSTIRAYGKVSEFEELNERKLDTNQRAYYPSISSNRWLAIRLEFLGSLIIFGASLFSVISVLYFKSINAAVVGLSVSYALQVTQTLNWMMRMAADVETNIVAVERIKEYIELPSEAPSRIEENAPGVNWPGSGAIEFYRYSCRYRPGLDLVLKSVNVSIKAGEKVGIVGRSGAGKSSLMLGLFRIVEPAEGTILIDGVDITKIGLDDLRSRITIIPQDSVLFGGSLRENLDPDGNCSDLELWSALRSSHLEKTVEILPGKLDAVIAQNGENFSVGQRQLICLARALLRKSKVLVLDEATAAIDIQTDALIQETIRKEFKACTVLTIAHRINTVMDSDKILVMDKGRVAEFDSPRNLLLSPESIFRGLASEAGVLPGK